jgi:hypothetical protein
MSDLHSLSHNFAEPRRLVASLMPETPVSVHCAHITQQSYKTAYKK